MPLYKLHEAPRAPNVFRTNGAPVTAPADSTRMVIDTVPPITTSQHHASGASPAPVPSASLTPSAAPRLAASGVKVPPPPSSHPPTPTQSSSSPDDPDSSPTDSPTEPRSLSLENAHFGHSLYFIEHLFPSKLWRILDDAERCGYDNVISWVDDGMAFQIHDKENVIPILEKYFNMSKYKSFLRQLQAYGFQRALPNPKDDPCRDSKPKRDCYRGKWSHKLFRRDKMNLCNKMTRDGKTKQDEKDRKGGTVHKMTEPSSPPTPPRRVSKSQEAIAKHQLHQKDAAQVHHKLPPPHPQQQPHHTRMQIVHGRLVPAPHAPPPHPHHPQHPLPPGYHDPRYHHPHHPHAAYHHPHHPHAAHPHAVHPHAAHPHVVHPHAIHHPPAHHPVHHHLPPGAPGAHLPPPGPAPGPAGHPAAHIQPGMTSAQLLAKVKQEQERRAVNHHLQVQAQQQNAQAHAHAAISNVLRAKGRELPPPTAAPPGTRAPPPPHARVVTVSAGPPGHAPAPPPSARPVQAHLLAGVAPAAAARAPAPPALGGINYNKPPAPGVAPPPAGTATDAVSEAANELRQAELALIERRKRLAEAQERAQKEAEALASAEAVVMAHSARGGEPPAPSAAAQELLRKHHAAPAAPLTTPALPPAAHTKPPAPTLASQIPRLTNEKGLPLTSLLEDLDNAFKTSAQTGIVARHPLGIAGKTAQETASESHKITEEELLRARAEAGAAAAPSPAITHLIHHQLPPGAAIGAPAPVPQAHPGPSPAEREVIMARINAMEQIRAQERQQQQQQGTSQHEQLLLKIAMAEREERERGMLAAASAAGAPTPVLPTNPNEKEAAVRDAIRYAALGLINGTTSEAAVPRPGHPPPPHPQPPHHGVERITAPPPLPPTHLPPVATPPGVLSKEMMDIFAKTAAAAIGKKIEESGSSGSNSASGTGANSPTPPGTTTVPKSPTLQPKADGAPSSKDVPPPPTTSGIAIKAPVKSDPTVTGVVKLPPPSRVSSTELEAAAALMKFPGSVTQPSKEPVMGHWELVKPEELRKGGALSKSLPDVVAKSAALNYEAYKAMAEKMPPPRDMRIPDGWDPRREPLYLVVDPANAVSLPPTAAVTSVAVAPAAPPAGNPIIHALKGPAPAPGIR